MSNIKLSNIDFSKLGDALIGVDWENLTISEKYKHILGMQRYNIYTGGRELIESDCSGTVSLALVCALDVPIRVDSTTFHKIFFTEPPGGEIEALFAVSTSKTSFKHFNRDIRKGDATHIAGKVYSGQGGGSVFLNANRAGTKHDLRYFSEISNMFNKSKYAVYVRSLNMERAIELGRSGNYFWGKDDGLDEIFSFVK